MTPAQVLTMHAVQPNGCWHWTGGLVLEGYGQCRIPGARNTQRAHRVVYQLVVGPIPAGLDLDHVCHNVDLACSGGYTCKHRRCVNPSHLEPVTRAVNLRRSPHVNRPILTCLRGHLREGRGDCRACERARAKRNYYRMKAAAALLAIETVGAA